jgi:hypothetical protein
MTMPIKSRKRKRAARKRLRPRVTQRPDAIAFTIAGYQAIGGPGKTKIYELGKAGVLALYKDAIGRTLIDGDSGREYLRAKPAA